MVSAYWVGICAFNATVSSFMGVRLVIILSIDFTIRNMPCLGDFQSRDTSSTS